MKTSALALLLLPLFFAFAQPPDTLWTRTLGGSGADVAKSVCPTSDGGYVVAGQWNSRAYIVKTDSAGNPQWSRTFGNTTGCATAIIETDDGHLAAAGWRRLGVADSTDMWLFRLTASGDSLWRRVYRPFHAVEAYALHQTTDGGYILGGYEVYGHDMIAMKTDSGGNAEWMRTYGGANNECCYGLDETTDGGFALYG